MSKLKLLWGTGKNDYSPKFLMNGLSGTKIQFAYRNVVGEGADTKRQAVVNWAKQVRIELGR